VQYSTLHSNVAEDESRMEGDTVFLGK